MKLSIIPSKEYPESLKYTRHELEIQDWVAKDKGILNRHKQEIYILKESQKRINKDGTTNDGAYYIRFKNGVPEEHWIPKSQCKLIERKEVSLFRF